MLVIGNTTELQVQYLLVKAGYSVFTPVNDGCSVDLCFIKNNEIKKVQIKTAQCCESNSSFQIPLVKGSKSKKLYESGEVDYFATTYNDDLYLIPFEEVAGKWKISMVTEESKRRTNKGISIPKASKYKI